MLHPPLTVADVKALVTKHGAAFAVLIAYFDDVGTQWLTYGTRPDAKVCASDLSEEISAWVDAGGCRSLSPATGPAKVIESFKLDAARHKAENERLRKLCADGLAYARHTLEFFEWSAFPHLRQQVEQLRDAMAAALVTGN